jgi:hypothetical protein
VVLASCNAQCAAFRYSRNRSSRLSIISSYADKFLQKQWGKIDTLGKILFDKKGGGVEIWVFDKKKKKKKQVPVVLCKASDDGQFFAYLISKHC